MRISPKVIITTGAIIVILWFLYLVRTILTPFILAAIFAYILGPLVYFLQTRFKLPRTFFVFIVYFGVVIFLTSIFTELGIKLAHEAKELSVEVKTLSTILVRSTENLPDWLRISLVDTLNSLSLAEIVTPEKIWPYFSGALSGIGGLFIFLISGFYFLKEGDKISDKFSEFLPMVDKVEIAILLKKISFTLNSYLRGQIFLIILMSTVSWLGLMFLGVRYALLIGIFTGFAEIVPFIGPIIAGTVAVLVGMFDGVSQMGFSPIFEGMVIASMYFVFRQMEDVFVIPHVLGHATRLHPLIVLFAVLAGGHLWGIMGMILAIPAAAIIRILLEFALSKIA